MFMYSAKSGKQFWKSGPSHRALRIVRHTFPTRTEQWSHGGDRRGGGRTQHHTTLRDGYSWARGVTYGRNSLPLVAADSDSAIEPA